jgi:hypothetical protein
MPLKESRTFTLDWFRPPKEPIITLLTPIIRNSWPGPRNFNNTKKLVIFGISERKATPK